MSQYIFSLPLAAVYSEDNFYQSACNREAHQWIRRWPDWNSHALLLSGPEGSGKTHLGHLWAARAGAKIQSAGRLATPDLMPGHWLIEDIEDADERALLHLLNAAKENGDSLLLTAARPAAQLPFTLPDLTSRLLALPAASIAAPDEETLAAVLRKQFADRQMKVAEEVIAYLVARMERSLTRAKELVERVDRAALTDKKNITVPFVRNLIG